MTNRLKTLRYTVLPLFITLCLPLFAQEKKDDPTQLLDHLAGNWVMEGTLGGKPSTHDVTAEWILNHEYLRFHEVSREKNKDHRPAYEAIVILTWDNKADEYRCLWLDTTAGGGLSVPTARAKRDGQSIPFVFPPPYDSLHTTFKYENQADRWQLTIDDVKDGKTDRFGNLTLKRVIAANTSHRPPSR